MRGINYNFCVLPHQSTEATKGRGGVSYRTFKLEEYDNETLSKAGRVSRDEVFARAKYFLEVRLTSAFSLGAHFLIQI